MASPGVDDPRPRWIDEASNRWLIAAIVLVSGLIVWVTVLAVSSAFGDSRQYLDLDEFVPGADGMGDLSDAAFVGLHDDTATVCEGVAGCIEGYPSNQATFYRFDSKEDAHAFAATLTDGYQSDWIVVDFGGSTLRPGDRRDAKTLLDSTWTSD